ncbi:MULTISPECIES: hypothetical protein [Aeromonas]|uniref:hypothetical protein n=1 Tax=Aeromonas TaxID=642 RepID=UPI0003910908|nr:MULTISPECIES: hypothetical protein [Aeromonas]MBL0523219.1 hypothetical protein [Aeromonas enteropelogenes]QMS78814.1 hypothetical protein M001_021795 [Aeromonas veronii Hm21]
MITVTDSKGQKHRLALEAIAQVSEASLASRWHGIRTYIKTFDGAELAVREDPEWIAAEVVVEEKKRYCAQPAGGADEQ